MSMTDAEEWEVVDDNGFIYKRRKTEAVLPAPATHDNIQEPVPSERAQLRVREALTRRKKVARLLAQKEMYAAEIANWEILLKRQEESLASAPTFQFPPSPDQVSFCSTEDVTFSEDLPTLNLQVEAYESFIAKLYSLLDQGEGICEKLEMDVETTRIQPDVLMTVVTATPRTLIHSLTSDATLPLPADLKAAKSRLGSLMENNGYDHGQTHKAE